MIRHVTNIVIINFKSRECNNLFKPLIKRNMKYIKFNQFLYYCTHNKNNKNEIKVPPPPTARPPLPRPT